jgi:hypothetical protein
MYSIPNPFSANIRQGDEKSEKKRGIQWSMKERLEDLYYADDIC